MRVCAGTDVDCGSFLSRFAGSALAQGLIAEGDIDRALQRQFAVRVRTKASAQASELRRASDLSLSLSPSLSLSRETFRSDAGLPT